MDIVVTGTTFGHLLDIATSKRMRKLLFSLAQALAQALAEALARMQESLRGKSR